MSGRLHPSIAQYLQQLNRQPDARVYEQIKQTLGAVTENPNSLAQHLSETLGLHEHLRPLRERPLSLVKKTEQKPITKQLVQLQQALADITGISFPNRYQCCAFILLALFPDHDTEQLLQPDYLFFEFNESYDEDGDVCYEKEEKLITHIHIDWCPHNILTDNAIVKHILNRDQQDVYLHFVTSDSYELFHYFAHTPWEEIPDELKNFSSENPTVWKALQKIPAFTELASKKLEECHLTILSKDGMFLETLGEREINNLKLVHTAISQNGEALNFASPQLQQDEYCIERAIRTTPMAILKFNPQIRNEPKWIMYALLLQPALLSHIDITGLDPDMQQDILETAMEKNPQTVRYLPDAMRDAQPQHFQRALQFDFRTIVFARPVDHITDEHIEHALQKCPLLFRYLDEQQRGNLRFIQLVLKTEPLLYQYLPKEQQSDPEIVKIALSLNPITIVFIQKHYVPDEATIRSLINHNPFLLQPDFITGNYHTNAGLMELYLSAILNQPNAAEQNVLEMIRVFDHRQCLLRQVMNPLHIVLNFLEEKPF